MKTETGYLELKDGKIYYEVAGEGETLVLSHAGFVDSGMWDDQWKVFSEKYRVIRYDMRGFGKSGKLDHPVARRDDLGTLLDRLKVKQAHLLGCSMGGEIVIDYALEHPERVLSLTAVSAVPSGFEMQGEPPAEIIELFQAARNRDLERQSELQIRLWVDGPFRQPEQVDTVVRQRAAAMNRIPVENATFFNVDMQAPENPPSPALPQLGHIQVPTLIIAGALDNSEILRASEVMHQAIPSSQKYIIDDAAHVPNMEEPAQFNHIVLDFLSRI
ncbi:MAG: alpha/beta fold hydrolase [Anaerolineaceae bacterium]|nr:alpha/beta fold hydrolase [Anaerolineaceae bacterium]